LGTGTPHTARKNALASPACHPYGPPCRRVHAAEEEMMAIRIDCSGVIIFAAVGMLAAQGCAHHRHPYAYAPPYAPPVYPQPGMPQQAVPAQPVAYPAAPAAVQTPLPPGAVVAPTMPVAPQTYPTGVVPTSASLPCPPTCDPCAAGGVVMPVSYEAGVQTQPCPPGP